MLMECEVDPYSPWDSELPKIVKDPRYLCTTRQQDCRSNIASAEHNTPTQKYLQRLLQHEDTRDEGKSIYSGSN